MCTAVTYKTKDFYFGRTLDYEFSYGEQVTVTPRRFPLKFRFMQDIANHYAIIGMAYIVDNYPLYYDAVNEKGLAVAGLNFVGNATYKAELKNKDNVAQFELIPWILCQCATVSEAIKKLESINITGIPFSAKLPTAQLHWIIADSNKCITVEAVKDGLNIYNNPVGVLTNNPPFNEQMSRLNDYMGLSVKNPKNTFCASLPLKCYSRGMGAMGLPGDLSSPSRFVRAAFIKNNSLAHDSEEQSVGQFFHILNTVEQPLGCCDVGDGKYEITIYSSCCNTNKGVYYYTTYGNRQITAVNMHSENIDGTNLISYPLILNEQINRQN